MFSGCRLIWSSWWWAPVTVEPQTIKRLCGDQKKECPIITGASLVASSCRPSSPGTFMRLLWICSQHAEAGSMLTSCCLAKIWLLESAGFIRLHTGPFLKIILYALSNKYYAVQCIVNAFIISSIEISTWENITCVLILLLSNAKFSLYRKSLRS